MYFSLTFLYLMIIPAILKKHCSFRYTAYVLLYIPFVLSFVSAEKEWKKNNIIPPKSGSCN